ncbi:MAG: PspC domain-containing protein [Alistipes sp.]|nr:PspC domain-containing protein [Alistipes senegalensis]MCM1251156.1 PspC domain-containing protein [Alistipes sp.]
MKETISANVGSVAFVLDCDAYEALKNYLDDLRGRLPQNDTETLDDIERHFAEIFRERVSSSMQVVTLEMVREAIGRMGAPSDFGEQRDPADPRTSGAKTLRRSRKDRSIAGICAGIAEFFDADPTLVRLLTLLLMLFGGLSLWVYILLWIVIPEAPAPAFTLNDKNR